MADQDSHHGSQVDRRISGVRCGLGHCGILPRTGNFFVGVFRPANSRVRDRCGGGVCGRRVYPKGANPRSEWCSCRQFWLIPSQSRVPVGGGFSVVSSHRSAPPFFGGRWPRTSPKTAATSFWVARGVLPNGWPGRSGTAPCSGDRGRGHGNWLPIGRPGQ